MSLHALSRRRALLATLGMCSAALPGLRANAQATVAMKVGSGNVIPNAQVFYAIDQGFFKKVGLDAELTIMRSGSYTMEGIVSGSLNAGVANTLSLGSAILRKVPFVMVAPGMNWDSQAPNGATIVARDSTIKSAKDLQGRTLGVVELKSIDELAFACYLDKNGVDPKSARLVEIVPSATMEAVATGRVDAANLVDPQLSVALAGGQVRTLTNIYDWIAKRFAITVWFATHEWIAQNKDATRRFAEGIVMAGEWAESNQDKAREVLAKYTKFKPDKLVARYGRKLDPALLQPVFDAAYKYKIYGAPLRAADFCWDGA